MNATVSRATPLTLGSTQQRLSYEPSDEDPYKHLAQTYLVLAYDSSRFY